jgi:catechol 2,3-dioxygenase-like lactoylglutathione lyase family enzyme
LTGASPEVLAEKSTQMIKGLFETHLFVEDLERSIGFYGNTLGLNPCYYEEERRAAFFWIGAEKQSMPGLWEKPKDQIEISHFAFECEPECILKESVAYLKARNLKCRNFLRDGSERPMVFVWIPGISIYFDDPDGHSLEFIGILAGKSNPEVGKAVVSYEEWLELQESEN